MKAPVRVGVSVCDQDRLVFLIIMGVPKHLFPGEDSKTTSPE